jgi:hypothetical protein
MCLVEAAQLGLSLRLRLMAGAPRQYVNAVVFPQNTR